MYELRIFNRYSYGNKTFRSDNLYDLKKKAMDLIIDDDVQLVEVKEIKADWLKEVTKFDSRKNKLTDIQSRLMYHNACIDKDFSGA